MIESALGMIPRTGEQGASIRQRDTCCVSAGYSRGCLSGSLTAACRLNSTGHGGDAGLGAALMGAGPALRPQGTLAGGAGDGSESRLGRCFAGPRGLPFPFASQGRGLIAVLVL